MSAIRNKLIILLTTSLLLGSVAPSNAQQASPKVEFTTLEFPQPIAVIPNATATNLFAVTSEFLKTNGFSIIKADKRDCTLEAHKTLTGDYEGYDSVLVWLERAVDDPATIKIQLLFGRFIKIYGKSQLGRVVLSKQEEESLCQPWKTGLVEMLTNTRG
jgi:hypothetical protein